ncbi:hypothetical protein FRZ06_13180 [Anoxybacterium hadale]|uniref:Uncharacterized protein n=1 Tax=Anoxybacterium hadale TaxID=3408580 RepID=A0ACD1AC98_9FIRM|nr:hypothetical protein FRZ06_13180 [Clostridiales bacterium]
MKIENVENPLIKANDFVKVKEMGNFTEVTYSKFNSRQTIQKLNANEYAVLDTGEIKSFNHSETRADDLSSVSKSLKKLRELICANVTDTRKCLWICLTYSENNSDPYRLYTDFKKFNIGLKRYIHKNNLPDYEYLVAMEAQSRGSLHAHLLLIFDKKAPFIPNDTIAALWKQGFCKTKSLKNVDNVGAYLSAYLGDLSLDDAIKNNVLNDNIKEIVTTNERDEKESKFYVKGARLRMLPKGFRLFRKSKGIKEPVIYETTNFEAMQKLESSELTFEKTIQLINENTNYYNVFNRRYYKKKFLKGTNKQKGTDWDE